MNRRSFLWGLGAAAAARGQQRPAPSFPDILRAPDSVTAFGEARSGSISLTRQGDRWHGNDVEVSTELRPGKRGAQMAVLIAAPKTSLTRVRLGWRGAFPGGCRFLGDHWERSYGDLEWRGLVGDRLMPWYFLASSGSVTARLRRQDRRSLHLLLAGGWRRNHAVA